jgi:hypothetical protein
MGKPTERPDVNENTEDPAAEFMRALEQSLKASYGQPGDNPPASSQLANGQMSGE